MNEDPKNIPITRLTAEVGKHALATSLDMKPYLEFMKAKTEGQDVSPQRRAIAELPLERRHVWYLASAMKWRFADFNDEAVRIDKQTLNPEDFAEVGKLLQFLPVQFCLFLKALLGEEAMERMMAQAVAMAKRT